MFRLRVSESLPTTAADPDVSLPNKCGDVAGLCSEPPSDVRVKDQCAFRLQDVDREGTSLTPVPSYSGLDAERSPWKKNQCEEVTTVTRDSQSVEHPVGVHPVACCIARGRHVVDASGGCSVDDRRGNEDFDERQLAELVQRNMDLNVRLNRLKSRFVIIMLVA